MADIVHKREDGDAATQRAQSRSKMACEIVLLADRASGRRFAVKNVIFVAFLATLLLCSRSAKAQASTKGMPQPPASQQTPLVPPPEPATAPAGGRIDLIEVRRDAAELARTAQTIPTDVESIRKGMLPRDVLLKLKQIERLSKRLRSELNP
jgi:hypothetical protein